ncbi:siderophore ABC transporter substrate-binding protein [Pararhodobacter sp.]|uniref:siderophore ABC transporter substrate-binding protein n=1 Tax=Pararhodobacter sp. TaxID=2127056 RepID=UPI002FDE1922
MTLRTLALAGLMALTSTTALWAETIRHAQGETEITGVPQQVLVFDLASLDNLDALGVPVAGAPGGVTMPEYLRQYAADIGTVFEPDMEAVAAMAPDLIIVGGRSGPKHADLSRIAPTIDLTLPREGFIAALRDNLTLLGRVFEREEAAAEQIAALDADIAALSAQAADAGRVLVVLTTGGRMSTHGPGSRFGVLFEEFGFTPAVTGTDTGTHGQSISHEFILETNPDWLFVVDRDAAIGRDGQAAQQFLDNELVRNTTAWERGQVVYLDPLAWYLIGGGVQALRVGIDQLSQALNDN